MFWSATVLILLLACSGLASGSETALFALSPQDRRAFAESSHRFRRLAARLTLRPRRVLMAVLIVNTAVNVGFFAVSYLTSRSASHSSPLRNAVGGALTVLLVIVFGEIIPKAIALANARRLAPVLAPFVHVAQAVTAPIAAVLRFLLVEPIVRVVAYSVPQRTGVSTGDLSALVELSAVEGIITTHEHDMLQTVVALPEISVRSIMVPRVQIVAVAADEERAEIAATFARTGLTKLPVYGRDLDDVRGLLYARDLYLNPEEPIQRHLRPVHYVPELINLLQLVRHFRRTRTQLAIVVDEYGGVAGLVSLEDVLEEIVGDLDTRGPQSSEVERIDERSYRLPGSMNVRPWRHLLGITDQLTDVDTFGGVCIAALGRLPRVGDVVRFGNLSLTVERLDRRRVDRVVLRVEPPGDDGKGGS